MGELREVQLGVMIERMLLTTILVGISQLVFAQAIPDDQKLLKLTSASTLSNPNIPKNLKFKIILKDTVTIDREKILLVICRAPGGSQHGHNWGWQNEYYLDWNGRDWNISQSFEEDHERPIGDVDSMQIVQIGKNKKALFGMFSSTGNHHYEKNIGIELITWEGLKFIGELDLDYTNSAFMGFEKAASAPECPYYTYEGSYQIEKSEKIWWDIKVKRVEKIYLPGCEENDSKQTIITYSFNGEEYLKTKP